MRLCVNLLVNIIIGIKRARFSTIMVLDFRPDFLIALVENTNAMFFIHNIFKILHTNASMQIALHTVVDVGSYGHIFGSYVGINLNILENR